jgi:two-component system, OmpR family, alkaline phosphatase synthesis response regulator PhoP
VADHLLLVEDEARLAANLVLNLEAEGHRVTYAADCAAAIAAMKANIDIDLIVLDVMLPDGSGMKLAERWRAEGHRCPILMLTARRATEAIVEGLRAGADDYLGKPFSLEELLVRVEALLRRSRLSTRRSEDMVRFGANQIDMISGRATTNRGERVLTALELRLLRHFARNPGVSISREELLREVWEIADSDKVRTRTLDTFIGRLRKYFETDSGDPRYFLTSHGEGYRFVPDA